MTPPGGEAQVSLANTDPSQFMVTDTAALRQVCKVLREAGTFGFDTEFIRERSYVPQLCLIQAATADLVALIDPFEVDAGKFWDLVTDPDVRKIVHAGTQDVEMCHLRTGRPGANIFDVQVAAGLVGLGYPLSYGKLVHAVMGMKIPQDKSYSEWGHRPLTRGQLRYAVADVLHLNSIHRILRKRLRKLGRESWMTEEMKPLETPDLFECEPQERWRRVQGWQRLSRRKLAVLRELAIWRDEGARRLDVPPRTFLRDRVLTTLARQMPSTVKELRATKGFPRPLAASAGKEVIEAIQAGCDTAESDLPEWSQQKEESAVDKMLVDLASATGQALCISHDLSHSLFASRANYAGLVSSVRCGKPGANALRLLNGWRKKFAGKKLQEMLAGQRTIKVAGKGGFSTLELD